MLDFQSTKCRSLDNASLSKLIPETDDAKLANASSLSTKDLNVDDSTEAVGEMEVDKEASSPSKKAQGFFDDLQSKFQIKSKELQVGRFSQLIVIFTRGSTAQPCTAYVRKFRSHFLTFFPGGSEQSLQYTLHSVFSLAVVAGHQSQHHRRFAASLGESSWISRSYTHSRGLECLARGISGNIAAESTGRREHPRRYKGTAE